MTSLLLVDAVEVVLEQFASATGFNAADYCIDGESFDSESRTTPWCRISVRHFPLGQRSLGGPGARKFDRGGSVIVQAFGLRDTGTKSTYALAQTVRTAMEAKSFGSVWTLAAEVREIAGTGRWYQVNVEIPFRYEEVK